MLGLFGSAWALMQFLFAPLLGSLSDRVGRRPVLIFGCFLSVIGPMAMLWYTGPTLLHHLETVSADLLSAVHSMHPVHASVWIRPRSGTPSGV